MTRAPDQEPEEEPGDGHSVHEEFARRDAADPARPCLLPLPDRARGCHAIAEFFAGAAELLHCAHEDGVLHRDVQPKNLFIERGGSPRILNESSKAPTDELAATPHYMSPEQVRPPRDGLDRRSDIYSLGAVLYDALTGKRPFEGVTPAQVRQRIGAGDAVVPANHHNPAVSPDLAVVCGKALEKRREDRFADAAMFASELRRLAAGSPILTRPPSLWTRARRLIRRRPLATVLPVATAAAAVIGWWALVESTPVELIVSDPAFRDADILLQRIEPLQWQLGDVQRLGRAPLSRHVATGYYRIWVVRDDAFAERTVALMDDRFELEPLRLRSIAESRDGMVELPAGPFEFGSEQGLPGRHPQTAEVAAFLIDATEVDNAAYRRYVEATGAQPPSMWPPQWREEWQPRWDRLPVAGVTHTQASAYAHWAGKRLPTEKEWERAARGPDGWLLPWRADYDRADVRRRAVVARGSPQEQEQPGGWPSRWASYLEHIGAVDAAFDAPGEGGPFHLAGNLTEWTETFMSQTGEGGVRASPGIAVHRGAAWNEFADGRLTVRHIKFSPIDTNLQVHGFRCAKSLTVPGS